MSAPLEEQERQPYDGDQKVLAAAGAAVFAVGTAFWGLLALKFAGAGEGLPAAAALAVALASAFAVIPAWGLRAKMQREEPVESREVRRLILFGLLPGVVFGFVLYVLLRYKLQDPDFFHLFSAPENLPPAVR